MSKKAASKYQRKRGVVFQEVDGLVHLLDEKEDAIVTLNKTATFLWTCLSKPAYPKELAAKLSSSYDVKRSDALDDVEDFLSEMKMHGFLSQK